MPFAFFGVGSDYYKLTFQFWGALELLPKERMHPDLHAR